MRSVILIFAIVIFIISSLVALKMLEMNTEGSTLDPLACTQQDLTHFHTDPATWNNMANYCMEWGDYEAAEMEFSLLIQAYPNFGIAYRNRGSLYEKMKRFSSAIEDYQTYLNLLDTGSCDDPVCIQEKKTIAGKINSIQKQLHDQ